MADLTEKQKLFIKEYLIDLNATQAAIRAGYSEKTSAETGYENLRKPQIAKAIQEAMSNRAEKIEISAEYVLKGIKDIADDAERDNDKLKAYELLGKHLKLFTDKVEHSGEVGVKIVDDIK